MNARVGGGSPPIDPAQGSPLALRGRVVTMDARSNVIDDGIVFIDQGGIVAVQPAAAAPPAGFASTPPVDTGATLYPGLIELHNHVAYNVLRLWNVPKLYTNRDQWGGTPVYQQQISGPMRVLGSSPRLMPAVVRWVEVKALVAGVTTTQGIELFSNAGARRYYRGIVRNVEQTDDPDLPEAQAKIADVDATDATRFLARLRKSTCFLLHLSEGTDAAARAHFLALQMAGGAWAITPSLSGIHCAALETADFQQVAANGGAMVWSPFSNLLLYGATARVGDAKAAGIRIGIGSDWSPTGSKNLLGELKVARLVSAADGSLFTDEEIVRLATTNAAAILGWEHELGSLEAAKRGDVIAVAGTDGDPYAHLLAASEADVRLVVINGVPRCGEPALFQALGAEGETITVGGQPRVLNLVQATEDPITGALTYAEAHDRLSQALQDLPAEASKARLALASPAFSGNPQWFLALDELADTGMELRPRLPIDHHLETGPVLAAIPLAELTANLVPLQLDALTVADDHDFLDRVAAEANLPGFVAPGLRGLYGEPTVAGTAGAR